MPPRRDYASNSAALRSSVAGNKRRLTDKRLGDTPGLTRRFAAGTIRENGGVHGRGCAVNCHWGNRRHPGHATNTIDEKTFPKNKKTF